MPKRKRAASDDGDTQPKDRKLTLRAARLEQKIEHGVVLLHRALKTARGFERQKLGRRQKTAKGNKDEKALERLAAEVEALKTLDLHAAAERYLIKQLVKTKRIAESSTFAQLDESKRTLPQDGPKDGPVANVTARLFNSNPVRDALPSIIDDIRKIIGVPNEKKEAPGKKTKKETRVEPEDVSGSEENGGDARIASDSDESMGDDGVDQSLYASQLAPSGSESESESEDDDEGRPAKSRYDIARDISLSPTPSNSDPDSSPATAQKSSKSKSRAPRESASTTTFLPSLTVGGYWSGSESEPEDEAPASTVRKNRMGQQARRKVWEKKYGAQANHIKKQKTSNDRDSGWDLRRGAVDTQDTRGKGKGKFGKGSGFNDKPRDHGHESRPVKDDRQRKAAGGRPSNKPAVDDKPLHPSWEAAKKAKEQKAKMTFQGKKVTFD